jgi:putative transposase
LGWTKFARSRSCIGKIVNATISRTSSNKYFVSILLNTTIEKLPDNSNQIGIDLGVKCFGTTSDGEVINNLKFLKGLEKRQKTLSRRLSKKQKGGKNYNKARIKLARLHEHIKNQRIDFLHKLSTNIVNENQVIVLEDLDVSDMLEKKKMSKSIQDVSLYEFRIMLSYKASWYGRKLFFVNRYFPSSQLCSNCGYKNPKVKNLDVREWVCPQCNSNHDRDVNAAINILNEGLKQVI